MTRKKMIIVVLVLVGGCSSVKEYQMPVAVEAYREGTSNMDVGEYVDLDMDFIPKDPSSSLKINTAWGVRLVDSDGERIAVSILLRMMERMNEDESQYLLVPVWYLSFGKTWKRGEGIPHEWNWGNMRISEKGVTLEIVEKGGKFSARLRFTKNKKHKLK